MNTLNETSFNAALEYIYSRRKYAKSSSLERMDALLNVLGHPQDKLRFVHIVGTNGKGSTAHMISRCLSAAGHTVGLFTSPFVVEFTERIQINNQFVGHDLFIDCVNEVRAATDILDESDLSPTFFETVLAVALLCFKKSGCGIVVLEAGIGGKHDSTNIIPAPLVIVITSISLDHTEMLGNTISKIACEKCGAIKPGSTAVSFPESNGGFDFIPQPNDAVEEIKKTCQSLGIPLIFPSISDVSNTHYDENVIGFKYKDLNIEIPFYGDHQIANACVAVEALLILKEKGIGITDYDIKSGMRSAFVPGRMETIIYNEKAIILDGGHNPGCMYALKAMVEKMYPEKTICAVLGFMKDKDYTSSIKIIAPALSKIIFVPADSERGEQPTVLAEAARSSCANSSAVHSVTDALNDLIASNADVILVAGSFYLISNVRKILTKQ